jgi:hypothetical protein
MPTYYMMPTYYKATRPDGTDFRTGEVDYAAALESGEVLKHPSSKMERNEPHSYFSVSVEAADCTGMGWPCRLFRVEPVGRVLKNDALPSKRCCRALKVVEELPAHLALGPNGERVADLIERTGHLSLTEASALCAARGGARGAAWDVAWDVAWGAARDAAWDAARDAAWARDAARDAALALLTRDLISEKDFNALYGPWAKVIDG